MLLLAYYLVHQFDVLASPPKTTWFVGVHTTESVSATMTIETGSAELVPVSSSNALLATLDTMRAGRSTVVSTFTDSSWETRTATFDAMTNALPISDNLGTVINLRNWVIQPVEMPVDEKDLSKGTQLAPRIILIDEDGSAFAAISSGVLKSLENLVGAFGQPSEWPSSIPVVVTEQKSRAGFRFMTLSLFRGEESKKSSK